MNWLYSLAEANLYLGVFYLAYCLFLNKSTHYQLNRIYLLFSCVVSFILPGLQAGILLPVGENVQHLTVDSSASVSNAIHVFTVSTRVAVVKPQFTLQDGLWYVYIAGVVVLFLVLMVKLYSLYKLVSEAQIVNHGKYKLVYLEGSDVAFSFFNYLFIGTNTNGANIIITHELVHIRQKHSADIIFLELLKIINWFNPFIYLLQNSLKTVHEYIADEQTAAYETDAITYSSFLVNNAYGAGNSSITHSFFNYNLLKKRIIMLNQKRSGNLARLKYLIILPIFAGLLCISTLAFSKTYLWLDIMPGKNLPATLHYKASIPAKTQPDNGLTQGYTSINDHAVISTYSTKAKRTEVSKKNAVKLTSPAIIPQAKIIQTPESTSGNIVVPDTISKSVSNEFSIFLAKNIHYSREALDNNITGKVVASFTVSDNKIDNVKIIRGISHLLDGEVMRVLQKYIPPADMPSGKYMMPFAFVVQDSNGKPMNTQPDINNDKTVILKKPANGIIYLDEVVIVAYK